MHAPEASLVSRVRNMRLSLARCLCGGSRRVAFQITAELSTLGKVMRQRHILTLWLRYSDCRKAACPRLASDEDTDAEACRRHEVPFYEESYKVRMLEAGVDGVGAWCGRGLRCAGQRFRL